jgi:hypothetical protein
MQRVGSRPQLYPRCYGSSEISLRNSDSGQALTVRVRTLPSEPIASANLATLSPFGVSTMRRRSSSPEVKIDVLDLDPDFLGKLLGSFVPFGSVLDLTNSLIGPVERQYERRHLILLRLLTRLSRLGRAAHSPIVPTDSSTHSVKGHYRRSYTNPCNA